MKVLAILALVAASSSAMALDTTMALKGRFDYINTESETNTGATGATTHKTSSGVMSNSYLRLATKAKLNETTSAKLVMDFAKAQAAPDTSGNLSSFVNEAFLEKSLGDFTFIVGKQAVLVGGRENDYSGKDVYLVSKFNDTVSSNVTGATVGYTIAGQNVYVQYLQQATSEQTPRTDKRIVGLAYYGSFMDKMIEPILSYHQSGTARIGQNNTHAAAGVRVNVASFTVEADYLMLTKEKAGRSTLTAAANTADAELNSMVAVVRYNHENFKPFVKYIMEDGKGQSGDLIATNLAIETERTAWELGLEYVPNKDEDMRYHLVYNSAEAKETTGTSKAKNEDKKIYAGLAFDYNILK